VSGPTESAELDRIACFSDGVFAIAITLLIVPLLELSLGPGRSLADALLDSRREVASFALIVLHGRRHRSPGGAFV
jgi:uncharacterized membrane protein